MSLRYRLIADRLVYDGFWRVRRVTFEGDGDGRSKDELHREVIEAQEAIAVLLFDPARDVVALVRQFRPAAFVGHGTPAMIEVCAGLLDPGEEPAACVLREALEETGLAITAPRFIARVYMSPGICTERISLFIATYDETCRVEAGGGLAHEGEDIEVLEIAVDDAVAMIDAGEIVDAKTVILLQRLQRERDHARRSDPVADD